MRMTDFLTAFAAATCAASVAFASCKEGQRRPIAESGRTGCPSAKTFTPYDPDRMPAGRRPGFIDAGGGTEIRIGGRTRFEYQYTR